MKKFFMVLLIFSIVIPNTLVMASDGEPPPDDINIENLKIPDNYDSLVDRYREMALLDIQYKQWGEEMEKLYNSAESDLSELQKTVDNLNKMIEANNEIIDILLKQNSGPKFGVSLGIDYKPVKPLESGLITMVNLNF